MEALAGVAFTFKVINEDATALTKTWANSRLQGPDAVLTMLKFLQRKLAGKQQQLCFVICSDQMIRILIREENQTPAPLFMWTGAAVREAGSCYR